MSQFHTLLNNKIENKHPDACVDPLNQFWDNRVKWEQRTLWVSALCTRALSVTTQWSFVKHTFNTQLANAVPVFVFLLKSPLLFTTPFFRGYFSVNQIRPADLCCKLGSSNSRTTLLRWDPTKEFKRTCSSAFTIHFNVLVTYMYTALVFTPSSGTWFSVKVEVKGFAHSPILRMHTLQFHTKARGTAHGFNTAPSHTLSGPSVLWQIHSDSLQTLF